MKIITLILSAFLIFSSLIGCSDVPPSDTQKEDTQDTTTQETTTPGTTVPDTEIQETEPLEFSPAPYQVVIEDPTPLSDDEIKSIISKVPTDRYEIYPALHNIPLSATLYKNGEVIDIDLNDPRLIGLINLYNNSVYYRQYSYSQGLVDIDSLEEHVLYEDFRLELKYNPYYSDMYDTCITLYDTFIITNGYFEFNLIAHDRPGYEGSEDMYPFRAVSHSPLHAHYPWLELFGF